MNSKLLYRIASSVLLVSLLHFTLVNCEGDKGDVGPAGAKGDKGDTGATGAAGADGKDGADGADGSDATAAVQGDAPVGAQTMVWNSFRIEDRRTNTDPGDIGIGELSLVKDDNSHYFYRLSSFNLGADGSEWNVWQTVSGTAMNTQNAFDASERPIALGKITKSTETIYVKLSGFPGRASAGDKRWRDWVVIMPTTGGDASKPGIVADLDFNSSMPRKLLWNQWRIEDRTSGKSGADPEARKGANGYAQLITNEDNSKYWLHFSNFQNIGQAVSLKPGGSGTITATKFAVFVGIGGAALNTQNSNADGDKVVYIGDLTKNGEQYLSLKVDGTIDATKTFTGAAGDIVINQNTAISRNSGNYIVPQKAATAGKWYDWIVLHPYEDNGGNEVLRPIGYAGLVIDLDAQNELNVVER